MIVRLVRFLNEEMKSLQRNTEKVYAISRQKTRTLFNACNAYCSRFQ